MSKRFWEIGAVVGLLGALGATYPIGKAFWERYQAEKSIREYCLREAKEGYYEDLHDSIDDLRSAGIGRVPVASPERLSLANRGTTFQSGVRA